MRCVVHAIGHSGLNVGENVLEVVHIVPKPFCIIKKFVNFKCKMYCIFTSHR